MLGADGTGSESDVTKAIEWSIANKGLYGIEVLNLSLGGSGCSDGKDATSVAVDKAHAAGLVVVVAAGNSGPGTCSVGSPAAAAGAMTVGAMADLGQQGFYQDPRSSRGMTADGRLKPDVSAPGVGVTSARAGTTGGYVGLSGTSMAAPFVAGVALLMLDANPGLTSEEVNGKIRRTAVDWGRGCPGTLTPGPDLDYGSGRLDGYAAIRSAGAPLTVLPRCPAI